MELMPFVIRSMMSVARGRKACISIALAGGESPGRCPRKDSVEAFFEVGFLVWRLRFTAGILIRPLILANFLKAFFFI